jgi:hypothetical protein
MNINNCFRIVFRYVDARLRHGPEDQLYGTFAKKVKLKMRLNEEASSQAEGRQNVGKLFHKYNFDNSSEVHFKKFTIRLRNKGLLLKFSAEESKREEDNKIHRYLFKETTQFHFKKNKRHECKLSSISTELKREPVSDEKHVGPSFGDEKSQASSS